MGVDATKETNSKHDFANNTLPSPGCANPFKKDSTALVDTAANISLLTDEAPATDAILQLPAKTILQPEEQLCTPQTPSTYCSKNCPPKKDKHTEYQESRTVCFQYQF